MRKWGQMGKHVTARKPAMMRKVMRLLCVGCMVCVERWYEVAVCVGAYASSMGCMVCVERW